jgi:hypothetical protein
MPQATIVEFDAQAIITSPLLKELAKALYAIGRLESVN